VSYVVDCSIIIRLLASQPGDDLLRQRLARTVHAPALLDAEVSSVVRGLAITGSPKRITAARAAEMLADYAGLRIVRYPIQPLQNRVFELRHNLTVYDALYVALSETLGLPLLTDDGKFGGTPGHHAEIHHYPN
jgi:predicted nucleic acid-binding protein